MFSFVALYLLIGLACHGIFEGTDFLDRWASLLGNLFNVGIILWWFPMVTAELVVITVNTYNNR